MGSAKLNGKSGSIVQCRYENGEDNPAFYAFADREKVNICLKGKSKGDFFLFVFGYIPTVYFSVRFIIGRFYCISLCVIFMF